MRFNLALIALAGLALIATSAQADPIVEDFDTINGFGLVPAASSPDWTVGPIGSGPGFGFTAGTSSASGSALFGRNLDDVNARGVTLYVMSSPLILDIADNLSLTLAVAGATPDFEPSDYIEIFVNGRLIDRYIGNPTGTNNDEFGNDFMRFPSDGVFRDVYYDLSAFNGVETFQLSIRMLNSSALEAWGIDSIVVNGDIKVRPSPEPASMALCASALLGMGAWRRRRRRLKAQLREVL